MTKPSPDGANLPDSGVNRESRAILIRQARLVQQLLYTQPDARVSRTASEYLKSHRFAYRIDETDIFETRIL